MVAHCAAGHSRAMSMACSRVSHVSRKNPPITSLVSANGPSVTIVESPLTPHPGAPIRALQRLADGQQAAPLELLAESHHTPVNLATFDIRPRIPLSRRLDYQKHVGHDITLPNAGETEEVSPKRRSAGYHRGVEPFPRRVEPLAPHVPLMSRVCVALRCATS